jgi:hypothetical protein
VLPSTPVNLATQLNNVQATIYVQTDVSQFAKFFGATLNVTTAGYSFKETPGTTFDVTLFENATQPWGGTIALSASDLTSTTIHELGHAIDFSYGVESSMQIYGTYISDDLDYLDTAGGGTPCAAGAGHAQGPFVGVIDTQTGQQMCTGTTLNNPNGIYSDPNNPGHFFSNSVIAQVSSHALDAGYINGINGWVEPYAETFAYSGYNSTLANPGGYNFASLTADGLFHKGYYQCAMTRAAALTGKAYAPTFNYSCN